MGNFWDYTSSHDEYKRIHNEPLEPQTNLCDANICEDIDNTNNGIDLITHRDDIKRDERDEQE